MDSIHPSGQRSNLTAFPWAILGSLVFFVLLWNWDFPQPMCDDLFYSGAGLNLASGGDLSNPLLARQHFPGHLFLIYPPVHSYVLAWWLKAFGISARTMTGFQIAMYFIIAAATICFLRKQGAPTWLEWLVPLGVAGAFLPFGLRTEPLSAALTMAGLLCTNAWGRRNIALFGGFFLMALGAATAPRTTFFSAAIMAVAAYQWLKGPQMRTTIDWRALSVMAGGTLAAYVLFCFMVDFRVPDLIRGARLHGHVYLAGNRWALLSLFFTRYLGFSQWPVVPLLLGLILLSIRGANRVLKYVGFAILAATPVAAISVGLGNGALWYMYLAVFVFAALVWETLKSRKARIFLPSAVTAVLLLGNSKTFVNIAGIVTKNIVSAQSSNYEEALAMKSTPEHALVVDEFVSRYVFDYKLPTNSIYWPFASPFPYELATETELLPNDIYLLGPLNVDRLNNLGLTHLPQPMWGVWKRRWSFYREPGQLYILAVKDFPKMR